MLMRTKPVVIDFHVVAERHWRIHGRLENWARWCRSRPGSQSSPMFRMAVTPLHWQNAAVRHDGVAVDKMDAQKIAKGIAALPEKHRLALGWCYTKPVNPRKAASDIGTTLEGLLEYVNDARQMLLNRAI